MHLFGVGWKKELFPAVLSAPKLPFWLLGKGNIAHGCEWFCKGLGGVLRIILSRILLAGDVPILLANISLVLAVYAGVRRAQEIADMGLSS